MKVVLFCGGLGMRIRDYSESIPKPMVNIGYWPILWHVMKYYAHYGHKDFILCLGYKSDVIKKYFLNYNEYLSNDFMLSDGGRERQLFSSDIEDWTIRFVDTGLSSNIGQRLRAIRKYVEDDGYFLANYTDGLTDLELPKMLEQFTTQDSVASFLAVRPLQSFHMTSVDDDGRVRSIQTTRQAGLWINGGYFIMRSDIFRYVNDGEELIQQPFQRLIDEQRLKAFKYDGFWACMDTFKEKQQLDDLFASGKAPWQVWRSPSTLTMKAYR